MATTLFPVIQFFDDAGDPLNGGLIYTYEVGTTTNRTTYQDQSLTTAQANPIVLSSVGRLSAPIWCGGPTKFVIKTSAGVALNPTIDHFNADATGLGDWSAKSADYLSKSGAYDLTTADDGRFFSCSGTWTLGTTSAASVMGDGYAVWVRNTGTGVITFNPTGSETIDTQDSAAATSLTILPQEAWHIRCDATNYHAMRSGYPAVTRFFANKSTAQSINNDTLTTITSWSEIFDNDSAFNPTSGVFTAPVAGIYLMGGTACMDDVVAGTVVLVKLLPSTAVARSGVRNHAQGTNDVSSEIVSLLSLALGETVALQVYHNHGSARNTLNDVNANTFWGLRVI